MGWSRNSRTQVHVAAFSSLSLAAFREYAQQYQAYI